MSIPKFNVRSLFIFHQGIITKQFSFSFFFTSDKKAMQLFQIF